MWSFSYTSRVVLIFTWGVSLPHSMLASFLSGGGGGGVGGSLMHPMLAFLLCGEFPLHIPCWLHLLCGEFLLHFPVLPSVLSGKFALHIPCYFHIYLGSFSYTSHADLFLCGKFLLHIPCCPHFYVGSCCTSVLGFVCFSSHFYLGSFSYTSHTDFIFIDFTFLWGFSLTHPKMAFFVWEVSFTLWSFFIFIMGISFRNPVLASFLCAEFVLHIPC